MWYLKLFLFLDVEYKGLDIDEDICFFLDFVLVLVIFVKVRIYIFGYFKYYVRILSSFLE